MSIQSVDRALSILNLFSASKTHLGITEIGKAIGLTSSTVHGLVKTLHGNGFLHQDPDTKKYSLGTSNFELGHYFLGASKVYQAGAAASHRLAEETELNTRLAILDRDEIVVILTVYSKPERFQYYPVGPRIPLYCTALGKAILAWLPKIDLNRYLENRPLQAFTPHTITDPELLTASIKNADSIGYVMDREEMLRRTVCIAAPIFDRHNNPIAALSLSSDTDLVNHENFSNFTDNLIRTAADISYVLGYRNIL